MVIYTELLSTSRVCLTKIETTFQKSKETKKNKQNFKTSRFLLLLNNYRVQISNKNQHHLSVSDIAKLSVVLTYTSLTSTMRLRIHLDYFLALIKGKAVSKLQAKN